MTQSEKTQFVAALRSGKFTQTQGRLRDNKGYCCIGVACAIKGLELSTYGQETGTHYDRSDIDYATRVKLIAMNDDQRFTFPVIADWVEANLETSEAL